MKKILTLLLCGCILIGLLASCGKTSNENETTDPSNGEEVEVPGEGTFYFEPIDSESVRITGYKGSYTSHAVTIPDTLDSKKVTEIGQSAFYNYSNLTGVTIPATIVAIGEFAFAGCSSIETIELPDGLEAIGKGAFYGCSGLKTLKMGNNVTEIGNSAFQKCTVLESFTVSSALLTIGDAAFYMCDGLTEMTLPEGLTSIGKLAFYYCHSLASINIPASVEEIGEYAFRQAPKEEKENEEIETNEQGEIVDTYVELVVTTVPGSYGEKYMSGASNEDETTEVVDPVTENESGSESESESES